MNCEVAHDIERRKWDDNYRFYMNQSIQEKVYKYLNNDNKQTD